MDNKIHMNGDGFVTYHKGLVEGCSVRSVGLNPVINKFDATGWVLLLPAERVVRLPVI